MEQVKKMKVVMVCQFSNGLIRQHISLRRRRLYHLGRKIFGLSPLNDKTGDIAPWDTAIINYFRSREDIDLHVISAYSSLERDLISFKLEGVSYNFICDDFTMMLKHFLPHPQYWLLFNPMRKRVHHLIRKINPDIILLVGLENPQYSATVLGIKGFPIYGLCQTIYNNPERTLYSSVDKLSSSIELKLLQEDMYYGVYCRKHYDLLTMIRPDAKVFKFGFPSKGILLQPTLCNKSFDFVNFALSLDERKGGLDSIKAIAIVKKKYPSVSLNLVGGCNKYQREILDDLIADEGLEENIIFTPFFQKQSDMFLYIQQSRFAVLPCKMDNISGTMNQAMQLGLPLVVYKTTGTPSFNKEKQCALIAEHSNVEDLAEKMLMLMDNPDLANTLRKNAMEFQKHKAEQTRNNGNRLVDNFKAIIANYCEGKPIPQEQLFNPEKDD